MKQLAPVSRSDTQSGFTLIEILIAISIFSLMSMIASTVLYSVFNAREKTTQQAIRLSELQLAVTLIERDLLQVVNRPILTPTGYQNSVEGAVDTLHFSRGGNVNPQYQDLRSSLQRVHYELSQGRLIRKSMPLMDHTHPLNSAKETLLHHVTQLEFQYIDDQNQLHPQWLSRILPKAIRVSLTLHDWGNVSLLFPIAQGVHYEINK